MAWCRGIKIKIFFIVCIIHPAFAGNEHFVQGARQSALGNSGVALKDPSNTSINPSAIFDAKCVTIGIGHQVLYWNSGLTSKSVSFSVPAFAGAANVNINSYGNNSYSERKYALAFARSFSRAFAMGLQFDAFNTSIAEYGSAWSFTGEVGVLMQLSERVNLGAHVYNPFHSAAKGDQAPMFVRTGVAVKFSDKLLLCSDIEKDLRYPLSFMNGFEYAPVKNLFLRTGFNTFSTSFSGGAGVLWRSLRADISFCPHPYLGLQSQVSLLYSFER